MYDSDNFLFNPPNLNSVERARDPVPAFHARGILRMDWRGRFTNQVDMILRALYTNSGEWEKRCSEKIWKKETLFTTFLR